MTRLTLHHESLFCIGCSACEVQCKSNKNIQPGSAEKPGASLCKIVRISDNQLFFHDATEFIFMPCFHCEDAACQTVCPSNAIKKRPHDGIVYIDPLLCIGCKSCISACQWGACQWDDEHHKAIKCDLCMDRIDSGKKPACVTVCPTQCLELKTVDEQS